MSQVDVGSFISPPLWQQASTTQTLDGDNHFFANLVVAAETTDIRHVHFRVGTVTVGDTLKVALRDTDLSDGQPGAVDDGSATVIIGGGDANAWVTATFDSALSITAGDSKSIVISFDSYVAGNLQIVYNSIDSDYRHSTSVAYDLGVGSWTSTSDTPMIALESEAGTYETYPGITPFLTANRNLGSGSTPDEIGNRFLFPYPVTIIGMRAEVRLNGVGFSASLYHTGGTVTYAPSDSGRTGQIDTFIPLTPTTIAADSEFRLAIKPTTASAIRLFQQTVDSADWWDHMPFDAAMHLTERTDGGAWSESVTKRLLIRPIYSQLSDGASSTAAVATPSLRVDDDGTGTSVTATLSGADAGVTYYLYRSTADGNFVQGSSRQGDGAIVETGLTAGVAHTFTAVGETTVSDVFGAPSNPVDITLGRSGGPLATPSGRTPTHLFRHTVDIQEPARSTTEGITDQSYSVKYSNVRCTVDDTAGSEQVGVTGQYGLTTHLIYMGMQDVKQRDRVKWIDDGGTTRYFDVMRISAPNRDRRLVTLHCQEVL